MMSAEEAVLEMLRRLFESFQTLDPRAMVPYYQTPSMSISEEEVTVMATATDVAARFAPLMTRLRAKGYARSAFSEAHVKMLSDRLALLEVIGARYKHDGQLLEPLYVTYTLRKIGVDWKIAVIASHPPKVTIARSGG
jgi:uncharacterized NTF2-like protein DUF6841